MTPLRFDPASHEIAPIDILIARSEARARLWQAGLIEDLPSAVDPLWDYALESGLVAEYGTDLVQDLFAQSFAPLRDDQPAIAEFEPAIDDESYCGTCGCAPCVNPGFCEACRGADERLERHQSSEPVNKPRSTPQTTIEAIVHTVRERGLPALNEPNNIERLANCDAAAKTEINRRIDKLLQTGAAA